MYHILPSQKMKAIILIMLSFTTFLSIIFFVNASLDITPTGEGNIINLSTPKVIVPNNITNCTNITINNNTYISYSSNDTIKGNLTNGYLVQATGNHTIGNTCLSHGGYWGLNFINSNGCDLDLGDNNLELGIAQGMRLMWDDSGNSYTNKNLIGSDNNYEGAIWHTWDFDNHSTLGIFPQRYLTFGQWNGVRSVLNGANFNGNATIKCVFDMSLNQFKCFDTDFILHNMYFNYIEGGDILADDIESDTSVYTDSLLPFSATGTTTGQLYPPNLILGDTSYGRPIQIIGSPSGSGLGFNIHNTASNGGDWTFIVTDDSNGEGAGKFLFINELESYPNNLAFSVTPTGLGVFNPNPTASLEINSINNQDALKVNGNSTLDGNVNMTGFTTINDKAFFSIGEGCGCGGSMDEYAYLDTSGFTNWNFTTHSGMTTTYNIIDHGNNWNSQYSYYTVAVDGTYRTTTSFRTSDGDNHYSYGISAGCVNNMNQGELDCDGSRLLDANTDLSGMYNEGDGYWFLWQYSNPSRQTAIPKIRVEHYKKGDHIGVWYYSEYPDGVSDISLTIELLSAG